jgi:hypothetical protein
MAKQKKKRNKKYSGSEAAITKPKVTRVQAVNRSKTGQWWVEHKRIAKPLIIAGSVIAGIITLVAGFLASISG